MSSQLPGPSRSSGREDRPAGAETTKGATQASEPRRFAGGPPPSSIQASGSIKPDNHTSIPKAPVPPTPSNVPQQSLPQQFSGPSASNPTKTGSASTVTKEAMASEQVATTSTPLRAVNTGATPFSRPHVNGTPGRSATGIVIDLCSSSSEEDEIDEAEMAKTVRRSSEKGNKSKVPEVDDSSKQTGAKIIATETTQTTTTPSKAPVDSLPPRPATPASLASTSQTGFPRNAVHGLPQKPISAPSFPLPPKPRFAAAESASSQSPLPSRPEERENPLLATTTVPTESVTSAHEGVACETPAIPAKAIIPEVPVPAPLVAQHHLEKIAPASTAVENGAVSTIPLPTKELPLSLPTTLQGVPAPAATETTTVSVGTPMDVDSQKDSESQQNDTPGSAHNIQQPDKNHRPPEIGQRTDILQAPPEAPRAVAPQTTNTEAAPTSTTTSSATTATAGLQAAPEEPATSVPPSSSNASPATKGPLKREDVYGRLMDNWDDVFAALEQEILKRAAEEAKSDEHEQLMTHHYNVAQKDGKMISRQFAQERNKRRLNRYDHILAKAPGGEQDKLALLASAASQTGIFAPVPQPPTATSQLQPVLAAGHTLPREGSAPAAAAVAVDEERRRALQHAQQAVRAIRPRWPDFLASIRSPAYTPAPLPVYIGPQPQTETSAASGGALQPSASTTGGAVPEATVAHSGRQLQSLAAVAAAVAAEDGVASLMESASVGPPSHTKETLQRPASTPAALEQAKAVTLASDDPTMAAVGRLVDAITPRPASTPAVADSGARGTPASARIAEGEHSARASVIRLTDVPLETPGSGSIAGAQAQGTLALTGDDGQQRPTPSKSPAVGITTPFLPKLSPLKVDTTISGANISLSPQEASWAAQLLSQSQSSSTASRADAMQAAPPTQSDASRIKQGQPDQTNVDEPFNGRFQEIPNGSPPPVASAAPQPRLWRNILPKGQEQEQWRASASSTRAPQAPPLPGLSERLSSSLPPSMSGKARHDSRTSYPSGPRNPSLSTGHGIYIPAAKGTAAAVYPPNPPSEPPSSYSRQSHSLSPTAPMLPRFGSTDHGSRQGLHRPASAGSHSRTSAVYIHSADNATLRRQVQTAIYPTARPESTMSGSAAEQGTLSEPVPHWRRTTSNPHALSVAPTLHVPSNASLSSRPQQPRQTSLEDPQLSSSNSSSQSIQQAQIRQAQQQQQQELLLQRQALAMQSFQAQTYIETCAEMAGNTRSWETINAGAQQLHSMGISEVDLEIYYRRAQFYLMVSSSTHTPLASSPYRRTRRCPWVLSRDRDCEKLTILLLRLC